MQNKTINYTANVLFTEVSANGVHLNKTFEAIDGKVVKTANAQMSTGSFRVLQVNNITNLDSYFNTLSSNQAIIAGVPKNNLLQGTIVPSGAELIEHNAISRTNFCFTESTTSVAIFDFDFDDAMPEVMKQIKSPEDFFNFMIKVIPELNEVELFIRPSSSSGIFNTLTNEYVYKNTNSYHLYLVIENCTKENLDNFIEWFKRKSLQVGLCYGKIYKNGSVAFKTLIDVKRSAKLGS